MKRTMMTFLATLVISAITTLAQTGGYSRNQQDCSILKAKGNCSLPPMTSNMPNDVLVSWMVSDSVCRSVYIDAVESFLSRTSDDTVQLAMKYYYRLCSYDPLALEKHRFDAAGNPLYKIGILQLGSAIIEEYTRRLTLTYIDSLMLKCSRVYTASIQSIFTQASIISPDTGIEYCACGIVDSVLKGDIMYDECGEHGSVKTCVGFSWFYSNQRPVQDRWWHMFPPGIVEPAKRYLVFIHDFPLDEDSFCTRLSSVTKRLGRSLVETAGVFEIVGDKILDPQDFFGLGKTARLTEVMSLLCASRSKMMNG